MNRRRRPIDHQRAPLFVGGGCLRLPRPLNLAESPPRPFYLDTHDALRSVSRLHLHPRSLRTEILDAEAIPVHKTIRKHNPLRCDSVLTHPLGSGNCRFASGVFETRSFFNRKNA